MRPDNTPETFFSPYLSINIRGELMQFEHPRIMGIINLTPDSFYGGSRTGEDSVVETARQMISDGADIIDIGAVSSRPGAHLPDEAEEMNRLRPALARLREELPESVLSIDTFRASVARMAVEEYGADLINDISAGDLDPEMFRTIAKLKVPYIIMHMKGLPENMQDKPEYKIVVDEVIRYFSAKVSQLKKAGLADIIIDPGFGFGKSLEHNYELLASLDSFRIFELPILVGLSRKSMIYKLLNNSPEEALNGTTALHMAALSRGANILRVHDVRAAAETVKIFRALKGKPVGN